ncbi:hypothetical protein LPJ64_001628 [Coemansia asiatica]|uniref:Uncharacterized protein n=1 Tax=Coemansia asiatica TaxID=1052880 RepID=A0A9W7XN64_9FUNG|nr:hypothetical protein LPJ64_001628 [Coemansia asiatica]
MTDSALISEFLAQNALKIVEDAVKGQKTIATRSIRRGDIVLSVHPLFGFPVRPGEEEEEGSADAAEDPKAPAPVAQPEDRCTQCFQKLPQKRPRCSQCHRAQYCSIKCLNNHWKVRHYLECSTSKTAVTQQQTVDQLARRIKPAYRPYLRMAIGVVSYVERARKSKRLPEWMKLQIAAWDRLVSHKNDHPKYVIRQYSEIADVIISSDLAPQWLTKDDIVDYLCRFGCNNFAAFDSSDIVQMTGHLCSPVVSLLFNHSCLPNALFIYSEADGLQIVRALDDIEEGEEISISYIDGLRPRCERQTTLQEVYFFACKCARCAGDNTDRARIDAMMDRKLNSDEKAKQMPHGLPTDFAQTPTIEPWVQYVVKSMLSCLNNGIAVSDMDKQVLGAVENLETCDLSFVAYRHWLECQDDCLDRISAGTDHMWVWAYVASLYVLAFYSISYPPFHPLVGRQSLQCAQLAWNALQTLESSSCAGGILPLNIDLVKKMCLGAQIVHKVSGDPSVDKTSAKIMLLLEQLSEEF